MSLVTSTATGLMLLLLLLCPFSRAWGCLNESGTTRDAKRTSRGSEVRFLRQSLKTELRDRGAALEAATRGSIDFTNRNDYAVSLIYQGRHLQAIEVLQELEQQKPGDYSVAANLGTALELAGWNEEALKWIQEGIRRNANSHAGTKASRQGRKRMSDSFVALFRPCGAWVIWATLTQR